MRNIEIGAMYQVTASFRVTSTEIETGFTNEPLFEEGDIVIPITEPKEIFRWNGHRQRVLLVWNLRSNRKAFVDTGDYMYLKRHDNAV